MALRSWFGDEPVELQPLGQGHINSTWRVELPKRKAPDQHLFVLQKINQAVFAQPAELMVNLGQLFTGEAARQAAALGYKLPQPLRTTAGEWLASAGTERLQNGTTADCHWRVAPFIGRSRTLQSLSNANQAEAAGRAFGEFQRWLGCLSETQLVEVIPGFHQVSAYVQALGEAASSSASASAAFASREQLLLEQLQTRDYLRLLQSGGTADQMIHGDCKVNNLLFAIDSNRVIAILDLDTLMRGPWWLDFGDLVRSATCTDAGEFQSEFYPALVHGFFGGRAGTERGGNPADIDFREALLAPAHMTYMLCVRFLTDHLLGDGYFNVEARGDNLRRAERQFRLLETLENKDTVGYMSDVLTRFF